MKSCSGIFAAAIFSAVFTPVFTPAFAAQAPEKPQLVIDAAEKDHVDYPKPSLERGEEGEVGFVFHADRKDRITSCQVTRTSGYAALDKATCDAVIKNGRFDLDDRGQWEIGGKKRAGTLAWVLPSSVNRPVERPAFSSAAEISKAGEKVICKYSFKAGSQIIEVKQCHTRRQWAKAELNGREEAIRLTVGGGTSSN